MAGAKPCGSIRWAGVHDVIGTWNCLHWLARWEAKSDRLEIEGAKGTSRLRFSRAR
jgi:hypothetical protein